MEYYINKGKVFMQTGEQYLKKSPKLKEVYYFIKSSLIMFYHVNQGCHKRSGAEDFPSQIPSHFKGKQNY